MKQLPIVTALLLALAAPPALGDGWSKLRVRLIVSSAIQPLPHTVEAVLPEAPIGVEPIRRLAQGGAAESRGT